MSKVDRLFLTTSCLKCAQVRAELDFNVVLDDNFRGKQEQELRVFTALSPASCEDLLSHFGIEGSSLPLIQSHDGIIVTKSKNIIMYLRRNGMLPD